MTPKQIAATAKRCAREWNDAYRAEYISVAADEAIIGEMLRHGLDEAQAEWLFKSKHMRWFYDGYAGSIKPHSVARDLALYLDNERNGVMDDLTSPSWPNV